MRTWIIGAAAALAVTVAPSVAAAQATGFADVSYTNGTIEAGGVDNDTDTFAVAGSVAFDMGAMGVQFDARIGNTEPDFGSDIDFWHLGGHLYQRSGNWLFGGFAGFGNTESTGSDTDEWTVGLETQFYMARTTVEGAVSYSEVDDTDTEVTALDVGLRHFVTDNFSIGGDVGFADLETTGGDADVATFAVEAEWQFDTFPVSVFGGYRHSESDDADIDVDAFSIGARYNWGGTLMQRDREGAGLRRRTGVLGRLLGGIV